MRTGSGDLAREIGIGALAGLAGTLIIQLMKSGSERWLPSAVPPVREEPGQFMVEKVEELLPRKIARNIPEGIETAAVQSLAFGYGMSFGALYGGAHPGKQRTIRDGAILGAVTWAAGYLGWLPMARLMPPIHKQKARQVLPNLLAHIFYGITTVASFRCIQRTMNRT